MMALALGLTDFRRCCNKAFSRPVVAIHGSEAVLQLTSHFGPAYIDARIQNVVGKCRTGLDMLPAFLAGRYQRLFGIDKHRHT